jgi:Outer membrane protein beta-barrel domain
MKTAFIGAALATLALGAAAQTQQPSTVRPMLGFGLTFGGDKLATVDFTNGDSESIRAGGLVMFYAGAEWRVSPQLALQGTVGYHVDDTSGSNGSLRFSRYPIDLLALFSVNERVRLGGGVEFANNPKVGSSGVLAGTTGKFKNSTGLVLEGEYLFTPQVGLKARYASHEFKFDGGSDSVDGSYFGLLGTWYFR